MCLKKQIEVCGETMDTEQAKGDGIIVLHTQANEVDSTF